MGSHRISRRDLGNLSLDIQILGLALLVECSQGFLSTSQLLVDPGDLVLQTFSRLGVLGGIGNLFFEQSCQLGIAIGLSLSQLSLVLGNAFWRHRGIGFFSLGFLCFQVRDDLRGLLKVGLLDLRCCTFFLAVAKQCSDGLIRGIDRVLGIDQGTDITRLDRGFDGL